MILILFILSVLFSIFNIYHSYDYVKEIYFYSGIFSLIFLNICVFFSILKFKKTKNFPKSSGISAFFWALIHFLNYFIFERNFNISRLLDDISSKMLEFSGFLAFCLLIFIFLSSFNFFKKISKIRKFVYLTLVVSSYHYFLYPKIPQIQHYIFFIISIIFFIISLKKINFNL